MKKNKKLLLLFLMIFLNTVHTINAASSGPLSGYGRAIAINPFTQTYVLAGFGYQYNSGNTPGSTTAQTLQTSYAMTCLARYHYITDRIDTTFNPNALGVNGIGKGLGTAGQVITDVLSNSFPLKVAIQGAVAPADQKIIVTGYCYQFGEDQYDNTNRVFVARYNWNGSLDQTFNPNGDLPGVAIYNILGVADEGFALLLLPDKKIVIAGGASGQLFIMRLNVGNLDPDYYDGSLDVTFNASGPVPGIFTCSVLGQITNPPSGPVVIGYDCAYGIMRQADGKLIVVGTGAPAQGTNSIIMVRLDPNGKLDLSFGTGGTFVPAAGHIVTLTGKVITKIYGFDDRGIDITSQADGKILITGTTNDSFGNYYFCVVRYLANGQLDTTFGPGGLKLTPHGVVNFAGKVVIAVKNSLFTVANQIKVQVDQKILVSGFNTFPSQKFSMFVARLLPSGHIDRTGFNKNGEQPGLQFITLNSLDSKAFGMDIQPDGKIILAGSTFINSFINQVYAFAVVKIKPEGGVEHITVSSFTHRILEKLFDEQADQEDKEGQEQKEKMYFYVVQDTFES